MSEISEKILDTLVEAARQASFNAYAPYSGFSVGAALLTEGGDIYVGCNVENASFGLTNCAERSALFSAVADGCGRGDFVALLIYTPGGTPHPPCGACRQVLSEFFMPEDIVYSACEAGRTVSWTMDDLLPDAFILPDEEE
ncbi:cytidine deaminase [Pseudodesulfovibrio cashew]|uniref:Cytidine deaminase n=1 Tax=Pseudodesulfovibrio cashew TaxID=2678688 RepID=A0A6I6JEW4_9BACT|nr:cytidine deaminase [Pseudodesulfovibrio cashew]QGY41386.1 cytidine deaminase [Pseudodesulfovibrio cashew]